ncbi:hypothetical protein G6F42_020083 [Rhizopus arrhizus]|nr:hypothetical protein G6F42_020083 [Rhizopus arrhizus]
MNLSIVFRVINIVVAAFMIIGGVMTCIAGGKYLLLCHCLGAITLNYGGLGLASGIIVLAFGVGYIVLHFFKNIEAPSNMQKRAYEDAVGYSTQVNDTPSPNFQSGGYPQPGVGGQPTYPSANYANPGAV